MPDANHSANTRHSTVPTQRCTISSRSSVRSPSRKPTLAGNTALTLHLDVQQHGGDRAAHRHREAVDAGLEVLLQRFEIGAGRELVARIALLARNDRDEDGADLFVVDR